MDKSKMSQILKLFLMAILICITPLLSSPLRPPYIYFVVNLIIVALGAEAGLLSFIFKTTDHQDKRASSGYVSTDHINVAQKPALSVSSDQDSVSSKEKPSIINNAKLEAETAAKKKPKLVEKSSSEKIVAVSGRVLHKVVRKSPSTPSLFFIGGGETDQSSEVDQDDLLEEEDDDYEQQDSVSNFGDHEISGQELFHKAETFIGNFYKQLKMQREESWKKIHGLYHKAF